MRRMIHSTVHRTAQTCAQSAGPTRQAIGSVLSTSEPVCSSSGRVQPSFVSNSLRSAPYCHSSSRCVSSSAIASRTAGKVICLHISSKSNVSCEKIRKNPFGDDERLLLQSGNEGSASSAALFFALPCLFTAFLGTWQVNRRQWKVDVLNNRTASLQVPISGIEMSFKMPP